MVSTKWKKCDSALGHCDHLPYCPNVTTQKRQIPAHETTDALPKIFIICQKKLM
jgi:hypothetical protein